MARELATERLVLGMWKQSDAAWYRELVGERGGDMPTLDAARSKVTGFRDAAVDNGQRDLARAGPLTCARTGRPAPESDGP